MWQVLVLAICKKLKWQEPWQESGTCHFFYEKVARTVARTMFKLYEDISNHFCLPPGAEGGPALLGGRGVGGGRHEKAN